MHEKDGKTIAEIIRFIIVGTTATAVHYGLYFILLKTMNENVAYTVGYLVSFLFNYIMSARFTFKKKTSLKNGVGFCAAHIFNYLLQISLLNVFILLGVGKQFAPIPVYCIAVPTNFLIVRFVFNKAK